MAIHRPSDSMSRCDPSLYENIYDVRRNPEIKTDPVKLTRPHNKDTIEISREALTEEALSRLRHTTKYVIAQNSFMRIGNYLFLAIALPPYLLLYGLPKWIIVEGIPGLFSITVWAWNKAGERVKPYSQAVISQISEILQVIQRLSQTLLRPFVFFASKIRQRVHRLGEKIFLPVKKSFDNMRQRVSSFMLKRAEGFNNLRKRLSNASENISRGIGNISRTIQENVQNILKIPQVFLSWGQLQFQRISKEAASLGVQWKNRWKAAQSFAQRGTDWAYKIIHHPLAGMKKVFSKFTQFYKNACLPLLQKWGRGIQRKWEKFQENLDQKRQRFLAKLKKRQEKLKQLSSKNFLQKILAHPWMENLPGLLRNWVKRFLSHPFTRVICDSLFNFYEFLARIYLQTAIFILQTFSQLLSLAKRAWNWTQEIIARGAGYLLHLFNAGMKIVEKSAVFLLYHFLLILTMLSILLIWAMQVLGVRTRALIGKLHKSIESE